MKNPIYILLVMHLLPLSIRAQLIPIDTTHWDIKARAHVIENFKGVNAIYLQAGSITLKDVEFLNGSIEFDIFLKEEQAFPGVYFRLQENGDGEQFYVRPHQAGNPDANQAAPITKNISPWQLYYGTKYSFPYQYKYNDWTHIKLLINDDQAQVFLDHSSTPHLSWNLFHTPKKGKVVIRGGNRTGMHIANVKITHEKPELIDFKPVKREPIEGLVSEWEISDMFEEKLLETPNEIANILNDRTWQGKIFVEEGTAANISRIQNLYDGKPSNTVLAKIIIHSDKKQVKLFEFGYSDRVVAILNGKPIYWGNNKWRSRDYRYLGTIGLFDGIYLELKKGKNELVMAVSEDFGGWLITGRFKDNTGIKVE